MVSPIITKKIGTSTQGNIKDPSKLFSPKYQAHSSLEKQNENSSSLKCVHFVNTIIIIRKENEPKETHILEPNAIDSDDRDLAVEYEKTIENESKVSKIIIEKRESSDVGNITKASNLEDESELGEGGEKLDKNTTLQACDFHSDAFTKSALKVEFLIKVVTSHVMEKASEITPDTVRLEERRRHNSQQREARGRFGGLTMSENLSDA
nr:hypothetical protein [Tanacetum cinerariifolium]